MRYHNESIIIKVPALLTELIENGFLSLSRQNPSQFSNQISFELENQTHVFIHAPGIIEFKPKDPAQKAIVLSCGIHGNETAPIEILDSFVDQLLKQIKVAEQRVLFLFGNLPAMDIGERFCEENLNRLFSGAHSEPPGLINDERKRAKRLEQAVSEFYLKGDSILQSEERYHYDLHTAIRASKNEKFAVYPLLHDRLHSRSQLAFLSASGVNTILLSESPTTTFSYFSSTQLNAHAFTVELGKVKPFGENDMSRFIAVRDNLHGLVCDTNYSPPSVALSEILVYKVNQVINKQSNEFTLLFAEDMPNFSDFPKGSLLATEGDTQYIAQYEGEAIVFPNANVALGQRALLTVIPTTLEKSCE